MFRDQSEQYVNKVETEGYYNPGMVLKDMVEESLPGGISLSRIPGYKFHVRKTWFYIGIYIDSWEVMVGIKILIHDEEKLNWRIRVCTKYENLSLT